MSVLIAWDAWGHGFDMSRLTNGIGFFGASDVQAVYLGAIDNRTVAYELYGAYPVAYMTVSGTVNVQTGDALISDILYLDGNFNFCLTWEDARLSINVYDDFRFGGIASILNGPDRIYGNSYDDLIKGGNGNDMLSGRGGDDRLYGEAGNDRLVGGVGDDWLSGGAGNDRLDGGAGDDIYVLSVQGDTITERAGGGIDEVRIASTYTLGAHLENLTLTGGADLNGTGNGAHNTLVGNRGANTLAGLRGNDLLDGGAGRDRMEGGPGNDTYFVDRATDVVVERAREGDDVVFSAVSYRLPANVEGLALLGSNNSTGTGNGLDNVLLGNGGNNVLSGGGGDDLVVAGEGMDLLLGGAGSDAFAFLADQMEFDLYADIIGDFTPGKDLIVLDSGYFASLTPGELLAGNFAVIGDAPDGDNYVLFDAIDGMVYYDPTGGDPGGAVPIVLIDNGALTTAGDFLIV